MTDAEIVAKVREIVKNWGTRPSPGWDGEQSMTAVARLLAWSPQPPAPAPTVRVRIAVAANMRGGWDCYAAGDAEHGDERSAERACEYLDGPTRVSYVTASVPLPVPQAEAVIEGSVEEGEG